MISSHHENCHRAIVQSLYGHCIIVSSSSHARTMDTNLDSAVIRRWITWPYPESILIVITPNIQPIIIDTVQLYKIRSAVQNYFKKIKIPLRFLQECNKSILSSWVYFAKRALNKPDEIIKKKFRAWQPKSYTRVKRICYIFYHTKIIWKIFPQYQ